MRRLSLASERGFTMVEVLVASVVLLVGIVGTLTLVQMAGGATNRAKTREGATNIARELLETARSTGYSQVGRTGWFTSKLQAMPGAAGNVSTPVSGTQQVSVARRGTTYTVTTKTCSVDDSKDGYGAHASTTSWCADSTATNTADSQPEDLKRVTVDVNYTTRGTAQPTIEQVATFSAGGAEVGPQMSGLVMQTPTPVPASAPVITSNPTTGNATFLGTSAGSADMRFSVNGVEAASGVVNNNNNGTYTFTWPISSLRDATYTIGATAIDALGVRGPSRTMQVKLARAAPVTPTNIVGGYNYVWVAGVKTLVVEGQWDANPEGTVTGYEVLRGATSVCGGPTNLSITCIDFNPASTGSTVYTFKTWYRDGAGASQSVQSVYAVTAPALPFPTTYSWTTGTSYSRTNCYTGTGFAVGDAVSSFAPGNTAMYSRTTGNIVVGCLPPFTGPVSSTAGTGTGAFTGYFKNSGTTNCYLQVLVMPNKNPVVTADVEGNGVGGSPGYLAVPPSGTNVVAVTYNYNTVAKSFAGGDQLSMMIGGFNQALNGGNCTGTTFYYNSSTYQSRLVVPLTGSSGGTPLAQPSVPTGLTGSVTATGTTLTWTAPATSNPAVDFYRIYRDGTNYANRLDTTDAVASTVATATSAGATSVTVASGSGFAAGQSLAVDTGANQDNVTVASVSGNTVTFTAALAHAHATGVPVGLRTVTWTDPNSTGGTHTYVVTAVSMALAESTMTSVLGPL